MRRFTALIIACGVIIWGDLTDSEQIICIQNKIVRVMTVLHNSKACYKGNIHEVQYFHAYQ
jgi:hypothetical protein